MTVGDLLNLLEGIDPRTPVVVPAPDHSYREATAEAGSAMRHRQFGWSEDHGDLTPPEAGKRHDVIIIR